MPAVYLHSSASHQSSSRCLCSSHGINTNSPPSSRLMGVFAPRPRGYACVRSRKPTTDSRCVTV
ncbi:hypothetical protein EYF80_039668 [Liparis tanakae]|uniref:Uncharacterized protein n=1 Tax=Liparis tanakae TaxID=230148 RepID=A0A4Z2GBM7_9TELE|nr:hypothetical protein EYF80_039668 [Liparis tanakae]